MFVHVRACMFVCACVFVFVFMCVSVCLRVVRVYECM